jgi:hypothetical protein
VDLNHRHLGYELKQIVAVFASQSLSLSWLGVGFLHIPPWSMAKGKFSFNRKRKTKAAELVGYAKTLYEQARRSPNAELSIG